MRFIFNIILIFITLAYIDIVLQLNGSEYEWHNGPVYIRCCVVPETVMVFMIHEHVYTSAAVPVITLFIRANEIYMYRKEDKCSLRK